MGCLCNYLQLSDDHDAMLEVGQPRGYSVDMDPGRFVTMCGGSFSRGLGGDPGVFVSEWQEGGEKRTISERCLKAASVMAGTESSRNLLLSA